MVSLPIVILRLALAVVLGGIIGLERESREHKAGMRTNALVSLGSALFTIISAYGFLDLSHILHVQIDPTRIASYIVAGIGFLGGGTIIMRGTGVRELTTAAAIWTVAAIGMACGVGFYWESILATLLTLFVLVILRLLEHRLMPKQELVVLHVWLKPARSPGPLMSQVYETCVSQGMTVETLHAGKEKDTEVLELQCRLSDPSMVSRVLGELRALDGVLAGDADLQALNRLKQKSRVGRKAF